ncbi:MAG: hypothetical protein IIT78_02500 [Mycoplasmataceae bacterium]|nr:hypothetical protein [Mycoplasmataceae bacterium]
MKKSIKIGLGILSLGFVSSTTIGTVISCSNDQTNNESNKNQSNNKINNNSTNNKTSNNQSNNQISNNSTKSNNETKNNSINNSSNDTLYDQNAKIIASLLPALFPKNINLLDYLEVVNETSISALQKPSLLEQVKSAINYELIRSMNDYVIPSWNPWDPGADPNPTVLTVFGTNYTASEITANLSINFPNVISLEKSYAYNGTTLNNVTFSYDNFPINFACTISGFISPLNSFINNDLPNVLQRVSLLNWNETIAESLNDKTALLNAIESNIKQQLNNNLDKLVINNIQLTPEEVVSGLTITIPNTESYSNGELQKFYVSISALNSNSGFELNVTGFKSSTSTNTI